MLPSAAACQRETINFKKITCLRSTPKSVVYFSISCSAPHTQICTEFWCKTRVDSHSEPDWLFSSSFKNLNLTILPCKKYQPLDSFDFIKYLWSLGIGGSLGFLGGSVGKESACNAGVLNLISGKEDLLEKEMATHLSVLVWKIQWTKEPGGTTGHGVPRVRHD